MVRARMPPCSVAESVARWPGPVILDERTGSFGSMAVSTTRRPPASTISEMLRKAPAGSASSGHETSRRNDDDSSLPKRKGLGATTIVFEIAHSHLGLAIEPRLSQEYGEHAEQDGNADHHDGARPHDVIPLTASGYPRLK